MDSREPLARLQSGQELLHTLAQSAQDHKAQLSGEAQVKSATEQDKGKQLPVEQGLWATQQSLKERQSNGSGENAAGDAASIGGGQGSVTAWGRPDLVLASPAGILQSSPKSGVTSAGNTTSLVAGQDINQLAGQNWALAAKDGIVLYTYGKASNGSKPNQETGIALHAASGNVNSQSQSGATHLAADKAVSVSSTAAGINASSPTKIVLTAGGAGITISGGNITLAAPGNITLKAGMKNFTGGSSANASVSLKKPAALTLNKLPEFSAALDVHDVFFAKPADNLEFTAKFADGRVSQGKIDKVGKTPRISADTAGELEMLVGSDGAWALIGDDGDYRTNTGEMHHDEDEGNGAAPNSIT